MTLSLSSASRACVCARVVQRLLFLTSLLVSFGFATPAAASVSCPQMQFGSWIQGTNGAWAKSGTVTASGLQKTCANGNITTGPESFYIIGAYAATVQGPSPFSVTSVNFYATTGGNSVSLTPTCSSGCTASGNGATIIGSGTATASVSYVDITGQTVTAAVSFDGNAITVSSFTISGGVYDATGPILSYVTPATGSPAGGTAVTLTGGGFTGATAVKFGATPAQSFTVDSANQISAVTPAGAAGAVSVSVTAPSGTWTQPSAYSYVLQSQATLSVTGSPSVISVGGTSTVSAIGGSGTGAVTYSPAGPACSFNQATLTLTAISPGTCYVTATKAADAIYAATSATAVVTVSKINQAPLIATAYPADIAVGQKTSVITGGGSGTGAMTYAITAGSSFCALSYPGFIGTAAGVCTVTYTRAGDTTYNPVSTTVDITVGNAAQAVLTGTATPASVAIGGTSTLSTVGGSGAGAVSYVTPYGNSSCSVSGSTVTGVSCPSSRFSGQLRA